MLKALRALRELDLLPHDEVLALDNAYRFLRRVEHRLQIEAEQQTHTVPDEPDPLSRLARSLRFSSATDFTAALHNRMGSVRPIFQRIISESPAQPAKISVEFFKDAKRAEKAFIELERGATSFHVATRTRQIFQRLRPILLDWIAKAADPDATLNQFLRFVESYGLRSLLFELLVTNPKLLELVVKTFDASRFAGDLLIRRPQLLEDITRDPTFDEPRSVEENLGRLDSLGATANNLDPIRAYRQRQLLRIILRDVLGLVQPAGTFVELSDVAEACMVFVAKLLASEQLTIIALVLALCLNVRVEFDAAGHMDSVSRNTERRPSLDIPPFWYTDQIEEAERRRDKKPKTSIASLRARRQSCVDQREGDPARVRCRGEVGPNFCFNKNDPGGTNNRKRAAHDGPVIQRRVHDFDPGRRSFARQCEAGRCGCGQHAMQIRFERA